MNRHSSSRSTRHSFLSTLMPVRFLPAFFVMAIIIPLITAGAAEAQDEEAGIENLRDQPLVNLSVDGLSANQIIQLIFRMNNLKLDYGSDPQKTQEKLSVNMTVNFRDEPLGNVLSLLLKMTELRGSYSNSTLTLKIPNSQINTGLWGDEGKRYELSKDRKEAINQQLKSEITMKKNKRPFLDHINAIMDKAGFGSPIVGPQIREKENLLTKKVAISKKKRTVREHLNTLTESRNVGWKIAYSIPFIETKKRMQSIFMALPDEKKKKIKETIDAYFKNQDMDAEKKIKSLELTSGEEEIRKFFETTSKLFDLASDDKKNDLIKLYGKSRDRNRKVSRLVYGQPLKLPRNLCGVLRDKIDLSSRFEPLIKQLGKESLKKRRQATRKLRKAGCLAEEDLKKYREADNPEIRKRVRDLLNK